MPSERYSGGSELLIIGEHLQTGQTDGPKLLLNATSSPLLLKVFHVLQASDGMSDTLDRLKVLINSSTPIVVMETSEEMRAVGMVRAACSELNMATFEWSIADGLIRSGSNAPVRPPGPEPGLRSQGARGHVASQDRPQPRQRGIRKADPSCNVICRSGSPRFRRIDL